ncbi:MAG: PIN domain-containing protein [Chloroflexota bacterium]
MIAYVDASVLLRVALEQPNALPQLRKIERGVSSALVTVESLRTLDRLRVRVGLADEEIAARRAAIMALIASLEIVDLDATVLDRAAQPMPTELGILDAIHLATALLWGHMVGVTPVMATHHEALALAAHAHGLEVVGVGLGGPE